MRKITLALATSLTIMTQANAAGNDNPFFKPYDTVHETVPFNLINNSHYEEAVDRGIEHRNPLFLRLVLTPNIVLI